MRFSPPQQGVHCLFYDKHKYTRDNDDEDAPTTLQCILLYAYIKYPRCVITFKCNLLGRCSRVGPFGRVLDINMKTHTRIHLIYKCMCVCVCTCALPARTTSNDTARSGVQLRHCYGVVKGN